VAAEPEASYLSLDGDGGEPPAPASGASRSGEVRAMYREMSRKEKCKRCYVGFYRGANLSNCKSHPGVLISGHRSNGLSSTWTCCGMKGNADGCRAEPHVPWEGEEPLAGSDDLRPWSARVVTRPNSWVTCLDLLASPQGSLMVDG